jgi:hypothetical protein
MGPARLWPVSDCTANHRLRTTELKSLGRLTIRQAPAHTCAKLDYLIAHQEKYRDWPNTVACSRILLSSIKPDTKRICKEKRKTSSSWHWKLQMHGVRVRKIYFPYAWYVTLYKCAQLNNILLPYPCLNFIIIFLTYLWFSFQLSTSI